MSVTEDYQSQHDNDYYDDIVDMTPEVQIPSGIGLTLLIIVGIGGNVLTIVAYFTDHKLRNVYHFFILNLAINDLLLCTFSMPFYAVYTLKEFTWPFGLVFCKIWMVIDFTCCFESILIMLILSIDRLIMIILGPQYFQKITMTKAGIVIGMSWLTAFLVYGPCIIGWDYWTGYSTIEPGDCDVEFAYDHGYTTATAIIEFTLPSVFLTSINAVIYYKIRQRIQSSKQNQAKSVISCSTIAKSNEDIRGSKEDLKTRTEAKKPSLRGRETKAAKLLAVLVVVFLICWAPYTITTVIISFCDECVHKSMYEFFNWVLWMKSAINPFLYAYNSDQYRANFRKLLMCKRHLMSVPMSESSDSNAMSNLQRSRTLLNNL